MVWPPGEPTATHGLPSLLSTIIGQNPASLRRPATASIGLPFGSKVQYCIELLSQMPVPGTSTLLPKSMPSVCVDVTTLPRESATTKCVVYSPFSPEPPSSLNAGAFHGRALSCLILAASAAQCLSDRSRSSGGGAGLVSRSPACCRRAVYASLVASAQVCR